MTITVTGPDKVTVDFPDGTDPQTIDKVMREHFSGGATTQAAPMVPGGSQPNQNYKEPSFLEKLQDPTTTPGAILKAPDMFFRGMTAGGTDYAKAAMQGLPGLNTNDKSFDQRLQGVRQENEAQRSAAPGLSQAMELAGGITSPVYRGVGNTVESGINAATRASPAVAQSMAQGAGRFAGYGAQGAAAGAVAGAGNAQSHEGGVPSMGDLGKSVATNAAIGGALGVSVPAALEGGAKLLGKTSSMLAAKAPTMTQDDFKAAAQSAYKATEDAGVYIKPQSFQNFVATLPDDLNGYHPKVTPGASNIISALQDEAAKGPITISTLDKLRSIASGASITKDPNEARLAGNIASKIDDFVDGLQSQDLLLGAADAKDAVASLKEARGLWKTYSKLKTLSDIAETGENLNDPTWVKNQFRAIIRKTSQFNRYSADEQEAIKQIAQTGNLERIAKMIPVRGIQMAAPYVSQVGQGRNVAALQNLVARNGGPQVQARPSPQISQSALALAARLGGQAPSPFASGGSNQ